MHHASVTEAHQKQRDGYVYVDVRSSREFASGHPEGAVNVPLLEHDDSGQMTQNPDFVRVMKASFAPGETLLIGCQAGMRSLKASQMLETFGFTDVTNVRGGFGGARDQSGAVLEPGWVTANLPVEIDTPEERTYEALLVNADRADQA
ncbi:MAG: rhodanese-like domain-containing protein [Acidobacteria bacterium]|nr:rhodanese-like domain-containing protein [Acidobacteriota bacterium]